MAIYLLIAFAVSAYLLHILQNSGLSGDQFISMFPDDKTRMYLYNNPKIKKCLVYFEKFIDKG